MRQPRRPDARSFDQLAHGRHRTGAILTLFDRAHERAADDHAVGVARQLRRVGAGADAEADRDRLAGARPHLARALAPRSTKFGAGRAGHARERDVVDERIGHVGRERDARVARWSARPAARTRGRSAQRRLAQRARTLRAAGRRPAGHRRPAGRGVAQAPPRRTPGSGCSSRTARSGIWLERARMRARSLERLRERRAAAQRALAGALDRRAVGRRIAEGHAELDHVGARFGRGDGSSTVVSRSGSPAQR